jgi:excisionase family DNA binding protein
VLCKGVRITEDLVRRLDELLRGFEPHTLHAPRMHRYAEAAAALGVSPQWLKVRVRSGEIPFHKVGTYVRFTDEDVDEIRASMRRGPAGRADPGGL